MQSLLGVVIMPNYTFSIATYNVENLFDLKRDGHEYPEYIPNSHSHWNRKTYTIKLRNIARVIADMNSDIIALEEIESYQALSDLKKAIQRAGVYYHYAAIATRKQTTTRVALLSKYKIIYAKELPVEYNRKYRSILEVKLRVHSEELYVFVNHWKSKSAPESRRIVSAKALRYRLNQLGHDKSIVLVGDFNENYAEWHTFKRKRRLNNTHGITGINHILKTIKDNNFVTLKDLKNSHKLYYNLWLELPKRERWSHQYGRLYEGLDNIIISPGMANGKNIDYIKNSFHRFTPRYLFYKRGKIYRWQMSRTRPPKHIGRGYSDHLPIMAKFKVY